MRGRLKSPGEGKRSTAEHRGGQAACVAKIVNLPPPRGLETSAALGLAAPASSAESAISQHPSELDQRFGTPPGPWGAAPRGRGNQSALAPPSIGGSSSPASGVGPFTARAEGGP